jgi:hypothetical protein
MILKAGQQALNVFICPLLAKYTSNQTRHGRARIGQAASHTLENGRGLRLNDDEACETHASYGTDFWFFIMDEGEKDTCVFRSTQSPCYLGGPLPLSHTTA